MSHIIDMSLPGFEPGTSALSEQRSNRAELQAHKNDYLIRFIRVLIDCFLLLILLVIQELNFLYLRNILK